MAETETIEALRRLALRLLYEVEQHNMDYHHRTSDGLVWEARRVLGLDRTAGAPGGEPGKEDP